MLDYFDMWDEFTYKSINDTKTMRYYNLIINLIDNQIDAGIRWLDSKEAEQYFKGETAYQKEVFDALEDEWDSILEGMNNSVEALLSEVYRRGKAKGYTDMRSRIRYTEQDKLALQFARDYNFGLIQRLNDDATQQIKNTIISGFLSGDHPNTIAPKILSVVEERLDGSTFSPKQRATMIARTEVSRVQNTGILQSYINEGYTEVKILTAGDDNVCTTCLSYAFQFNKDSEINYENRGPEKTHNIVKLLKNGQFPPFHPLCRCTYLSVWKSKGKPPKNPYVICLIPIAFGFNVPKNLKDSYESVVNLSRKEIQEKLEIIIDDSDELNSILDLLDKNFRNNVYNTSYEWGAGIGMEGECQKTYTNWLKDNIFLSDVLSDAVDNKGILTFIHSHPFTTTPFASFEDYIFFVKNKIKYGIVTNEFGIFVVKNKHIKKSSDNISDIEDISSGIQREITHNFQKYIEYLDQTTNHPWLSEDKYNAELQNFINENHEKYLDKYKIALQEYMDITFIKA